MDESSLINDVEQLTERTQKKIYQEVMKIDFRKGGINKDLTDRLA